MIEDSDAVNQFNQLLNEVAQNRRVPEQPLTAQDKPFSVHVLLDYVHDPMNISPEIWQLIDQWTNNSAVQEWLKLQSKEGERREYGIVYDVVKTTSPSGIQRTEVKFIDEVGRGGFVYSTTSGSEDIARLQAQEPSGFQKGDLVETSSNANVVVSRKKFRGSAEDELKIRVGILKSSSKIAKSLHS